MQHAPRKQGLFEWLICLLASPVARHISGRGARRRQVGGVYALVSCVPVIPVSLGRLFSSCCMVGPPTIDTQEVESSVADWAPYSVGAACRVAELGALAVGIGSVRLQACCVQTCLARAAWDSPLLCCLQC